MPGRRLDAETVMAERVSTKFLFISFLSLSSISNLGFSLW